MIDSSENITSFTTSLEPFRVDPFTEITPVNNTSYSFQQTTSNHPEGFSEPDENMKRLHQSLDLDPKVIAEKKKLYDVIGYYLKTFGLEPPNYPVEIYLILSSKECRDKVKNLAKNIDWHLNKATEEGQKDLSQLLSIQKPNEEKSFITAELIGDFDQIEMLLRGEHEQNDLEDFVKSYNQIFNRSSEKSQHTITEGEILDAAKSESYSKRLFKRMLDASLVYEADSKKLLESIIVLHQALMKFAANPLDEGFPEPNKRIERLGTELVAQNRKIQFERVKFLKPHFDSIAQALGHKPKQDDNTEEIAEAILAGAGVETSSNDFEEQQSYSKSAEAKSIGETICNELQESRKSPTLLNIRRQYKDILIQANINYLDPIQAYREPEQVYNLINKIYNTAVDRNSIDLSKAGDLMTILFHGLLNTFDIIGASSKTAEIPNRIAPTSKQQISSTNENYVDRVYFILMQSILQKDLDSDIYLSSSFKELFKDIRFLIDLNEAKFLGKQILKEIQTSDNPRNLVFSQRSHLSGLILNKALEKVGINEDYLYLALERNSEIIPHLLSIINIAVQDHIKDISYEDQLKIINIMTVLHYAELSSRKNGDKVLHWENNPIRLVQNSFNSGLLFSESKLMRETLESKFPEITNLEKSQIAFIHRLGNEISGKNKSRKASRFLEYDYSDIYPQENYLSGAAIRDYNHYLLLKREIYNKVLTEDFDGDKVQAAKLVFILETAIARAQEHIHQAA